MALNTNFGAVWPDFGSGFRPLFGARKAKAPAAASDLLAQLKSDPSLAVRMQRFQQLKAQQRIPAIPVEKEALKQAQDKASRLASQYAGSPEGLNQAIEALKKDGYYFLFADTGLFPGKETYAILAAFDYDKNERREYLRDYQRSGDMLLAGELLAEHKNLACFIKGRTKARPGYFLFDTPQERLNPASFWHELFHALQHETGLFKKPIYEGVYGSADFLKREMEASAFVIENAKQLKLSQAQLKMELKIWGMRYEEYLAATGKKLDRIA